MSTLLEVLLIIAGACIFLMIVPPVLALHFLCDRHVDYRTVYSPEEFGLPEPEQMHLRTSDGLMIWAQLFVPENPRGIIVIVSGIDGPSVTSFGAYARVFLDMGLAVYMPELRGHGPSEGSRICLAYKENADLRAVCDEACARFPGLPLTLMGLSMGAATVLRTAGEDRRVTAVVSMSGFSSTQDYMFAQLSRYLGPLPAYPYRLVTRVYCSLKYSVDASKATPLEGVKHLDGRPILLVHSVDDRVVPYYCFCRLVTEARKQSDDVRTITVGGHNHFIISDMHHPQADRAFFPELVRFLNGKGVGTTSVPVDNL